MRFPKAIHFALLTAILGSLQVYLIRKIKEQPRALLRDSDKRIVSVPLNHPALWKIVKRGGGNERKYYTAVQSQNVGKVSKYCLVALQSREVTVVGIRSLHWAKSRVQS